MFVSIPEAPLSLVRVQCSLLLTLILTTVLGINIITSFFIIVIGHSHKLGSLEKRSLSSYIYLGCTSDTSSTGCWALAFHPEVSRGGSSPYLSMLLPEFTFLYYRIKSHFLLVIS